MQKKTLFTIIALFFCSSLFLNSTNAAADDELNWIEDDAPPAFQDITEEWSKY